MKHEEELEIIASLDLAYLGWIALYSGIQIKMDQPLQEFITWLDEREEDMLFTARHFEELAKEVNEESSVSYGSVTMNEVEGINVLGLLIRVHPPYVALQITQEFKNRKQIK